MSAAPSSLSYIRALCERKPVLAEPELGALAQHWIRLLLELAALDLHWYPGVWPGFSVA